MNTSVRKLLIAAMLLMPLSSLYAQENPHARAMREAFVMTRYAKYTENGDSANVVWDELDGGGLVPKEKIYFVELSPNSGHIGPLYLDGHQFTFHEDSADSLKLLRRILDAFDKQAPYASTYYSYKAGDEQAAFPGICVTFGTNGDSFPLRLEPEMNVRVIGFKDEDGFRSTYLLSWYSRETEKSSSQPKSYETHGIFYEFHCPQMTSVPQVKSYDPDEYLERTNIGLDAASNLVWGVKKNNPQLAAELQTDTLMEKGHYTFGNMIADLYKSPEISTNTTSYSALKAKLERMEVLSKTANPTELLAICHTLDKVTGEYPSLLSGYQVEELNSLVGMIELVVPESQKHQVAQAYENINTRRNLTEDIDRLSKNDQEFLNTNCWRMAHRSVDYPHVSFTGKGEHYTGDSQLTYFDVKGSAVEGFHAETTLKPLTPGRYRLSAVVRAAEQDHSGIHVFVKTGTGPSAKTCHKEIPAKGNKGGNVWFSAFCRFEERAAANQGVYALDINKATANGGRGFGWNRIYIDDIVVDDDTPVVFGVTTRTDITGTSTSLSKWFSACDFILEKVD